MDAMPSGIAMMLKAILPGFDPATIATRIEEVRKGAAEVVQHFDARLKAIEAEQKAQRAMLEELLGVARKGAPALGQAESNGHTVDNGVARISLKG
jgi:hypothetical protein